MNLGHPVLQEMLKTGCSSQAKVLLAFQTYLELCEVHVLKDVQYHYNEDLDIIYLAAVDENPELYVPISVKQPFTTEWLSNIHQSLSPSGETKTFNLVIRDSEGSSVIYRITNDLVPPSSPETTKKRKLLEEKKCLIAAEIKKKIPELYSEALYKKENK
ncbi:hypothetical protein O3M35_006319 [Rhynocoris fuscipes]|uniref:tRNA-splicing endonuclease subunit Sen15 domain-containing protein n=1 Tax=Rhynocoris fuscipes TaxID=488301 RepID=A0AAW1DKG1_9HEMI